MTAKSRGLVAKNKALRLQPDSIYLSRIIQTFFNKFTKKGKKALSRRHILLALRRVSMMLRRPSLYKALMRVLRDLRVPFQLVTRRKGRKTLEVPVPLRRINGEAAIIQSLYTAVQKRHDRTFYNRISQELFSLAGSRFDSPTYRQRNLQLIKIFEERVNVDKRWK